MPRPYALLILAGLTFTACPKPPPEEAPTDGGVPGPDAGTTVTAPAALDETAVIAHVTELASDAYAGRDDGTPGGDKARAYLIAALQRCGVQPAGVGGFEQPIATGKGTNVLGLIPGTNPALANRHVLVSAHFDHLGECGGQICNGANDNAAGVAAVLGIACSLAQTPPQRSTLIALWDAEEPPTFLAAPMGSQYFTTQPTLPLSQLDVAVVVDLIGSDLWDGYPGHYLLGAELSTQVSAALDRVPSQNGLLTLRGGLHLVEETPFGKQPWSDYDAFRDLSVPVLFLSDGQNKRYHQPNDDITGLNLTKLRLEAQHTLRLIWELGNASETPVFTADAMQPAQDVKLVSLSLEAALASGGIVDTLGLTPTSRALLSNDLNAVRAVAQAVEKGTALTTQQISTLRRGAQHLMCLAGSSYPEAACALL